MQGDTINGGYYILLLCVNSPVNIEYSGTPYTIEKGLYAYIGSALKSLNKRIKRHTAKSKKTHWHIDKLTVNENVKVLGALTCTTTLKGLEPCIASNLESMGYSGPPRFGSTDDRRALTHLFHVKDDCTIDEAIIKLLSDTLEECCKST